MNDPCFHPHGFLFQEFSKLFSSLFDKAENHIRVVKTLAKKHYGLPQSQLFKIAKLPVGGGSSLVLQELEECGFIMSFPDFGKKVKERHWRLTDEYTLFYLSWIEKMRSSILRGSDPDYWLKQQESTQWLVWAGYSFENICLKNALKIKQALGLGGISTIETQYFCKGQGNRFGAQIDLVIDRADGCVNLCEIKFSKDVMTLTKQDKLELERKRDVFRRETKTHKTLFTTMITPYGVEENPHYISVVQQQLNMNDLF